MDDDDKIVGTILTRREALRTAALAGFSLALGGFATSKTTARRPNPVHLVATPAVEEGPFFIDEKLNRSDITGGDTRKTVAEGSPLKLHFTVLALKGGKMEPLQGAHVDIWHADAGGSYSDEASGPVQAEDTKGHKWLRGYQITDANGRAEFKTIYPGWYKNRTPHIHVKIRTFDAKANKTHEFTTQLFFDEDTNDLMFSRSPYNDRGMRRVRNLWDGDYQAKQADGTMVGSHLHFDVAKSKEGHAEAAHFALALKLD